MKCRHCASKLKLPLLDLGSSPPSNAYLTRSTLSDPEKWFPLNVMVCEYCWLVQTQDFATANELFNADYSYFSGFSNSWLEHSQRYVADMVTRFNLTSESHIVEVACNDGYLLQYFKMFNIPCTGVEPTSTTAAEARAKGIVIVEDFFGERLANELTAQGKQADLTVANNVLAHVPDINDFVTGFAKLLKPLGVATFEFHHLLKLIEENQFDTIYHEHFSYLSLTAVNSICATNGLRVFDVEEYPTHGGSLRVFVQRIDCGRQARSSRVEKMLQREARVGISNAEFYSGFQAKTDKIKNDFLAFLLEAKSQGKSVAAYGAAAKGNTLLNYAGIRPDLISFVVDRNPAKQDKFMPGSRIPIAEELRLKHEKPNYVVILPWNLKEEIMLQLEYVRVWGGSFVTAVPEMRIEL